MTHTIQFDTLLTGWNIWAQSYAATWPSSTAPRSIKLIIFRSNNSDFEVVGKSELETVQEWNKAYHFDLTNPIQVKAGDLIGWYNPNAAIPGGVVSYGSDGSSLTRWVYGGGVEVTGNTPQSYFNSLDFRIYSINVEGSTVNPPNNDFGIKAISWSSMQRFTVNNVLNENLIIGSLSITGSNSPEFVIQNDNCSNATLAPHETRTFDVIFTAASLGSKSASVSIPIISPSVDPLNVPLTALVTEICECDLNADGRCNMRDWLVFGQDWGRTDCLTPGVNCECDLNTDGRCNMRDWLLFGKAWGRTDCPTQ
jgi:hypothetical protein